MTEPQPCSLGDFEYPGACISSHALCITLALILLLGRCAVVPLQMWTFSAWSCCTGPSEYLQWVGGSSVTLLSSVSQPSWCSPWDFCENLEYSIWFTTRDLWRDFTIWCYWCSWVGCRGSCDHREELQVSIRFSVSRLIFYSCSWNRERKEEL